MAWLCPVPAAAQTPQYSVTNLGPLLSSTESDYVTAVSADGNKVVGQANVNGTYHSFYWDGAMHDAGAGSSPYPLAVTSSGVVLIGTASANVWTLADGSVPLTGPNGRVSAAAMNDSAVVAGGGDSTTFLSYNPDGSPNYARVGLRWSMNPSTGAWDYTELLPLDGHNVSGASRIDTSGNIIGASIAIDPTTLQTTSIAAVRWSPGDGFLPHQIGPLTSGGLSGVIDGFSVDLVTLNTRYVWNTQSPYLGFYTDWSGTTQLPQPSSPNPQNIPRGVNANGLVAGFAQYGSYRHAYCWANGVQSDLGVLSGGTASALSQGVYARPIDDNGFIVGQSWGSQGNNAAPKAFLSTPASRGTSSKLLDLNSLLSSSLKSVGLASLTNAISVNDAGYVICDAASTGPGYQRAVLLTRVR